MAKQREIDVNSTQFKTMIQQAFLALAAFAAGRGWLSSETATELANWLAIGVPILIGIWQTRDKGKIAEAAKVKGDNGEKVQIIAPQKLADAIPKANVHSASDVAIVEKSAK